MQEYEDDKEDSDDEQIEEKSISINKIQNLLFQFCDIYLEVHWISMIIYHLELTPESYNLTEFLH